MKNKLAIICLFFSLLIFTNCEKETPITTTEPPIVTPPPTVDPPIVPEGDQRIAFYNVENLFDVTDDPNNDLDDEFLPSAAKEWDETKYQDKLKKIGQVMERLKFPEIMAFAEVENRAVLEALLATDLLKDKGYEIVHEDSPDYRGIDVALIYKKASFTVSNFESIEVKLPASVSNFSTTRDILKVEGLLNGEEIFIFVNHWPSRSGGAEASNGKRVFAAEVCRMAVDDVLEQDPNANIIVMGDLNDEPFNDSVMDGLQAQIEKPSTFDNQLYNCTVPLTQSGGGSSFYQGDWQMIDQVIVSGKLLDGQGTNTIVGYNTFNDPLVLFAHPDDGMIPNRTYGGDNYYGGFSDHLAIYVEIKKL